MENKKFLFLTSLFLILASFGLAKSSLAADFYVSQNGTSDGTSCTNSKSIAWLNNFSNWNNPKQAGKAGPGDTVHLCGTLSSSLIAQASGSSGNPITILFESGAKFSAPTATSDWIQLGSYGYFIVDAADRGSTVNIELTDNGTTPTYGGTFSFGNSINGISGWGGNYTIQNLKIWHLYQRLAGSEQDGNRNCEAISLSGSNILIQGNYLYDADTLIGLSWGTGTTVNYKIKNNVIERFNHGITIGTGGESYPVLNGVEISGNSLDHSDVWNCLSCGSLHLDDIIIFNESPYCTDMPACNGNLSNLKIFNNFFGGNTGKATTGAIFVIAYRPEQLSNAYYFNNVFLLNPGNQWNNGFIVGRGKAYNNTIYSPGQGTIAFNGLDYVENNIVIQPSTFIAEAADRNVTFSDQNLVYPVTDIDSGKVGVRLAHIGYSGKVGNFLAGETVNFTSGGQGRFYDDYAGNFWRLRDVSGNISQGDTGKGARSGAYATVTFDNSFEINYWAGTHGTGIHNGPFIPGEIVNCTSGGQARYSNYVLGGPPYYYDYIYVRLLNGTCAYNDTMTGATSRAYVTINSIPTYPQPDGCDFWYDWISPMVGWDTHSQTSMPSFVDASNNDFRLASSDTAARNHGANLTGECATVPELCYDRNGTVRPSSGNWDIGAYEYVPGGDTTPPAPPTGLEVK